jgi:hypothetical protein
MNHPLIGSHTFYSQIQIKKTGKEVFLPKILSSKGVSKKYEKKI